MYIKYYIIYEVFIGKFGMNNIDELYYSCLLQSLRIDRDKRGFFFFLIW